MTDPLGPSMREIKTLIMAEFETRPVLAPSDIMELQRPGIPEIRLRRAVWTLLAEGKIEFTQERELRRVDQEASR